MLACVFALLLWLPQASGCQSIRPKNVQYRPGRFDFDFPSHRDLGAAERSALQNEFTKDIERLASTLQSKSVLEALRKANVANAQQSDEQIRALDEKWSQLTSDSPLVKEKIDAKCSDRLVLLRNDYPAFAEIFVTDKRGLNVCQTNMTSDYFQADEFWWQDNIVERQPSNGQPEYDESSRVTAIAIYVPVLDPKSDEVIGLGKGLVRRNHPNTLHTIDQGFESQ